MAAPHAGDIEPGTGDVADSLHAELSTFGVDSNRWILAGFGAPALDRWHVRSLNIHPAGYPGLGQVAESRYGFTLSVHGHDADHTTVGGTADRWVRERVRDHLVRALPDEPDVRYRHDNAEHAGRTTHNFVNWLRDGSDGGIQLELTKEHRRHRRAVVAGCRRGLMVSDIVQSTRFRVELDHLEGLLQFCVRCSLGGSATYWTCDLVAYLVSE